MSTTFEALGVPAPIVAALARRGITEPFPIQAATIADGLAGRDLSGKAPTGSGKTIAFGIPMVARVTRSAPKKPHGLVLTPTRELAIQVAEELMALGTDLRILAVYGGAGIEPQIKKLRAGVDIVVATPGRLKDLIDRNVCDLRAVTFAVVDEADRMADMGFLPEVKRILDQAPSDRQTVLFSATLDGAIDELVRRYQVDPVVHEMEDEPSGDVTHRFWLSERPERLNLLADIVARLGHTVVFCRTKHGSDRVARQLGNAGIKAAAIHGNRSQAQRERALEAFHRGDIQALVATDVAARGIHVEGVLGVVHFDIPADPKDYIHRSGRTGRAGSPGTVVALFDAKQRKDAVKLKKDAGIDAEVTEPDVASLPEAPQRAFMAAKRPGRGARPQSNDQRRSADKRPTGGRPNGDRPTRSSSSRPSTDRPARSSSSRPSADRSARPERTSRPEHADRSDRPARSERSDRPERSGASRSEGAGAPRAKARPERSDGSRGPRSERPSSATRADAPVRTSRPGRAERAAAKARAADEQRLPADTPGSHKVRASGASRRKAKREALVAAGEPAPRSKKKRSGKPRPKPAAR